MTASPDSTATSPASCAESASRTPPTSPSPASGGRDGAGLSTSDAGLYLMLLSIHGLIRGHDLELGRDADTGGQTKYVVELTRALAAHPRIWRVDLLTRLIDDPRVDDDYSSEQEPVAENAFITRIPCGPRRYLRKETLWTYLDGFADNALLHIRRVGRLPDVIHSHYADAGYVGARLAGLLGVPLVHTGHSLGREKKRRLLVQGMDAEEIEKTYNMSQRIEAEELAMDNAAMVIASTTQEVEKQYSVYDNYQPQSMVVIPPGVALDRFYPPRRGWFATPDPLELGRFLREPRRPMILALARPDERKNIATLLHAYGQHPRLQRAANLVLIAGIRDDISAMERGPRAVLNEILLLIDRYDLYGRVACPKHHHADDVPLLYRLAAKRGGIFVNPALTEPFGLTLIEAAASGLPIVATEDGGPRDIIAHCRNGVLIDPLDHARLGDVLYAAISNRRQWRRWAKNGVAGAHRRFSWSSHVSRYLSEVEKLMKKWRRKRPAAAPRSKLPTLTRILITDIDNTLIGDRAALQTLLERMRRHGEKLGFGVATGRRLESVARVLKEWDVPTPDVLITSVGTEIHYGKRLEPDLGYQDHLEYRWAPQALPEVLNELPGLRLQAAVEQRRFKVSFLLDPGKAPSVRVIKKQLRRHGIHATVVLSNGIYLDVIPVRASKGKAIRYIANKWGIPIDSILVAGDSGNDEEMLTGNTLGVVVGNHCEELKVLRGQERVYFARGQYALGILEGVEFYNFFDDINSIHESVG
ncbi:MAG: HAD-IIB family hydrolase [Candidatus Schekmanbacteria bacterium]|nr:HAD-IIB family hydrolase [Candidatus Schekmanbacteria bacterium]